MIKFSSSAFKPETIDGEPWSASEKAALLHLEINGVFPRMGGFSSRGAFIAKIERLGLVYPGKLARTPSGSTLANMFHDELLQLQ